MTQHIDPPPHEQLAALRPRLHRYCARMVGSAVDGEDMVQDTMIKALKALDEGTRVDNLEAWLLRIGHNTCLDFIRSPRQTAAVPISDELEDERPFDAAMVSVGFSTFLRLAELQRCAVILKDVLGHSIDEVAVIADCTPAAAKSALQRGRATLRRLASNPVEARVPLMSTQERERLAAYVSHFQRGDFDTIRTMLAEEVRLELVNRLQLQGKGKVGMYFTRYAEEPRWRYALGAVEGRPAMLVFDGEGDPGRPAHWALIEFEEGRISAIKDFLFAPYAIEGCDWIRL